jgi:hypothetical protein
VEVNHKRKEVKTMKYEAPEVVALVPAINAIQFSKASGPDESGAGTKDVIGAYEDWEE